MYAQSFAQITFAVDVIIKTSASYFDLKKWRHIATLRLSRARLASASNRFHANIRRLDFACPAAAAGSARRALFPFGGISFTVT